MGHWGIFQVCRFKLFEWLCFRVYTSEGICRWNDKWYIVIDHHGLIIILNWLFIVICLPLNLFCCMLFYREATIQDRSDIKHSKWQQPAPPIWWGVFFFLINIRKRKQHRTMTNSLLKINMLKILCRAKNIVFAICIEFWQFVCN